MSTATSSSVAEEEDATIWLSIDGNNCSLIQQDDNFVYLEDSPVSNSTNNRGAVLDSSVYHSTPLLPASHPAILDSSVYHSTPLLPASHRAVLDYSVYHSTPLLPASHRAVLDYSVYHSTPLLPASQSAPPDCSFISEESSQLVFYYSSPFGISPGTTLSLELPVETYATVSSSPTVQCYLSTGSESPYPIDSSPLYSPTIYTCQAAPLGPAPPEQLHSPATNRFDSSPLYSPTVTPSRINQFGFISPTPIPLTHTNQSQLASAGAQGPFPNTISQLLTQACCSKRCLAHLSIVDVERCREWFGSRNTTKQNQFLLDTFHISGFTDPATELITFEGKDLCKKAFTSALGISIKRYDRVLSTFHNGAMQYHRKPVIKRTELTKVSEAKAWMKLFFAQIGDHMPHVNQIHLPHFMTKRDVYVRMKRELAEEGIQESAMISLAHFYNIWNMSFKNVVIPVVRQLCIFLNFTWIRLTMNVTLFI